MVNTLRRIVSEHGRRRVEYKENQAYQVYMWFTGTSCEISVRITHVNTYFAVQGDTTILLSPKQLDITGIRNIPNLPQDLNVFDSTSIQ